MGNQDSVNASNQQVFAKEDLKRLYKRFCKLDKDHSGELEPEELQDLPSLKDNPLVKRVIPIFDKNKDGKISFVEFIAGLAQLSSATDSEDKVKFAFKIYDFNEDGYISNGDLYKVLKLMVGNNLNDVQLQQIVDRTIIKADGDNDGKIGYEEFLAMVKDLDIASKLTLKA